MGLQNPVMSAQEKFTSSIRASGELIGAIKGKQVFSIGERRDKKKEWDTTNDTKLNGIVSYQVAFEKLLLLHDKHSGAWLVVRGITDTGAVLAAM